MLCCGLALALGAGGMSCVVQGKSPTILVMISYLSCESVPTSRDSSGESVSFWFRPVVGAALCLDSGVKPLCSQPGGGSATPLGAKDMGK